MARAASSSTTTGSGSSATSPSVGNATSSSVGGGGLLLEHSSGALSVAAGGGAPSNNAPSDHRSSYPQPSAAPLPHHPSMHLGPPEVDNEMNFGASPSWDATPQYGGGGPLDSNPFPMGQSNVGTTATAPSPESSAFAIKLLVSNNVAGSIIGRSGQTISELQTESHTRLKLSQSGDFFPGTQDRVCLVQGEPDAIKVALRLLLERMYMLQESQHAPTWQKQQAKTPSLTPPDGPPGMALVFDFVVRLLVPLSCCGMIIGKSGSNIKLMEESTGVSSIRLSAKDENSMVATSERIVTLTGQDVESMLRCCYLVLDGMVAHPEISQYANMTTSYANCMPLGTPPGFHPSTAAVGSISPGRQLYKPHPLQFMPGPPPLGHMRHDVGHPADHHWGDMSPLPSSDMHGPPGLNRRSVSTSDLPGSLHMNHQPSLGLHPRLHSHSEDSFHSEPPSSYMTSSYSPLQMPQQSLGFSHSPHHHPVYLAPRQGQGGPPFLSMGGGGGGSGEQSNSTHFLLHSHQNARRHSFSESAPSPNLLAAQLEQSLVLTQTHSPSASSHFPPLQTPPPPPHEYNTNSILTPQPPTMIAPGCFNAQVLIPDTMVGSILGRGGRTLTELQMLTGTRIRISQRGEYMPGTRSRIVTVRGPTAPAVWHAQFMMSQRMVLPPTASYGNASASTGNGAVTGSGAPLAAATTPPYDLPSPTTSTATVESKDGPD
jgi:KH domain